MPQITRTDAEWQTLLAEKGAERGAFEITRHAATAVEDCPSLAEKNITPHTLRHTCAMMLLHAGIDTASIALWLGHATIQTTQSYLHADLELKRRSLDRLPAIGDRPPARYQASDALIAFLTDR